MGAAGVRSRSRKTQVAVGACEGGAVPHGHLVHESADLDPAPGDLLAWIAADRGLSTTLIQAVTAALETP